MNWLRQTKEPLFPDILWSQPENVRYAGKLMIIGGHKQSFNAVSEAYSSALKAGIGTARVILPDALQKPLKGLFLEAEFAPSNAIGSYSRQALDTLLKVASWADAVLLAGDFGRNSETAVLLEGFVEKYNGKLALAGDTLDYFAAQPGALIKRPDTLLIGELTQLQKLASPALIQQKADFIKIVEQLSDWVKQTPLSVVTEHSGQIIVGYQEQIFTTPVKQKIDMHALAAYATVWWLQQPGKPFEAITTGIYCT